MTNGETYPQLNFPAIRLRARHQGDTISVFDAVRGGWVVLTPEEWVRQHALNWLVAEFRMVPQLLVEEYPVDLNGQPQRADIVAVDREMKPMLLVECKAPDVEIDAAVFAQAVRYNSVLHARRVMLTNGLRHRFFETDNFVDYTETDGLR